MDIKIKLLIFQGISLGLFICALSFLLKQSMDNYKYYRMSSKDLVLERRLYEEIGSEVLNNLKTHPIQYFTIEEQKVNNSKSAQLLFRYNTKIKTSYDCRGVFLEQNYICDGDIISNRTICKYKDIGEKEHKYNENISFSNLTKLSYIISDYDFRSKLCRYVSNYTGKISQINGSYVYNNENEKQYDYIKYMNDKKIVFADVARRINKNNPCPKGEKKCGEIDTKGNILCLPNETECPVNKLSITSNASKEIKNKTIKLNEGSYLYFENSRTNNSLVINAMISETWPLSHEWTEITKDVSSNSYIPDEEIKKRNELTALDFDILNHKIDTSYKLIENNEKIEKYLTVENVLNTSIIQYNDNEYNKNQSLFMFTKNYIGFKSEKDFRTFLKYFDENDRQKNKLFKISKYLVPSLGSFIGGVLGLAGVVCAVVFLVLNLIDKMDNEKRNKVHVFCGVAVIIYLSVYLIMRIVLWSIYPKIKIEMDERIEEVLDLYNERRKMIFLNLTVLFLILSTVSEGFVFRFVKES